MGGLGRKWNAITGLLGANPSAKRTQAVFVLWAAGVGVLQEKHLEAGSDERGKKVGLKVARCAHWRGRVDLSLNHLGK